MSRTRAILFSFVLLAGQVGCPPATDEDGDGWTTLQGDCDDGDASIYPGAPELCNGKDDNCDSAIDEGLDADHDQDGASTCPASGDSIDCDDTDPSSYPGALESCDGKDNDCNGMVDEEVAATFYIDGDGDGYGASTSPVQACTPPDGTSARGDDCDDAAPDVYPGASEACDGYDNDCDEEVDEDGPDADLDGLADCLDTCPVDPDNDVDQDGVCGDVDLCPSVADTQTDGDGDGAGDACDRCPSDNPDDGDGDGQCGSGLPPDPATVAPPLDPTVTTSTAAAVSFLYEGDNPIQQGVEPGTIEDRRVAVIRGQVLTREGDALPGAEVSVLNHPELGYTQSRADGWYDLAVNGGTWVTLEYHLAGYAPAQRTVQTSWESFTAAPDVRLVAYDLQVTEIDGSVDMQVAQGSLEEDEDGARQATLMFPQGTVATLVLPDGTQEDLEAIHVRATEYTVGEGGPGAMPGALPPTSGYTYAVELSVDEAVDAGASEVTFNTAVPFYVENFLDFPVGGIVPVGYYDRARGVWVPSDNGLIVEVLEIADGLAVLDVEGSGTPASDEALASLGITDTERQRLAELYLAGQSLWRVRLTHFSPWDCNWPYGPPEGATSPATEAGCPNGGCTTSTEDDPVECYGSIIECQNQVLGERIQLPGVPGSLNYRTNRTHGWTAGRMLSIPLTGASPNAQLKRVELEIVAADHVVRASYAPAANLKHTWTWDGTAYGRPWTGELEAQVTIRYVYPAAYYTPATFAQSFAQYPASTIVLGNRATGEIILPSTWDVSFHGGVEWPLGGWTLGPHHRYNPASQTLYSGSGEQQLAQAIGRVITTVAGNGSTFGISLDGSIATATPIIPAGVTFDPAGNVYLSDLGSGDDRVRKVTQSGGIWTVAGNQEGYSGDGGPATFAQLHSPSGLAFDAAGGLLIADSGNYRVRRVGLDGVITTIAGNGFASSSGDGGFATDATLSVNDVAVDGSGNIYVADGYNNRVRRVTPDGRIMTVAGDGSFDYGGDGGPATLARLRSPTGLTADVVGNLYIAELNGHRIRRVARDGTITSVAGTGTRGYSGDGGPATLAQLNAPGRVAVDAENNLYIADYMNHRMRRVASDGTITTVAGTGVAGYSGDKGVAIAAKLQYPYGAAVDASGGLGIVDTSNYRVRKIGPVSRLVSAGDFMVSSDDGREVYSFDETGRHLETRDALTNALRYTFGYNDAGHLITVTDGDGNVTSIERTDDGSPTAIIGPHGQRNELTLDENGYLASVTTPAGSTWSMTYDEDGLLETFVEPNGIATADDPDDFVHTIQYESDGRLLQDNAPDSGYTHLSRTTDSAGYTVAVASAEGRTARLRVEHVSTGGKKRINTAPGGEQSTQLLPDGSEQDTATDGTRTSITNGPDPRWGMMAPVATSTTITTPAGKQKTVTASRTVTLSNSADPLSLTSQTDTSVVNGKTWTSVFQASSLETTATSPKGRKVVTTLDSRGRVVRVARLGDVPGPDGSSIQLHPLELEYDALGRLTSSARGDRSSSIRYFPDGTYEAGYVEALIDPMDEEVAFDRDADGWPLLVTLADDGGETREIGFDRDPNGNRIGITPPGRPAHGFTYTQGNQLEDYLPPILETGTWLTHATYNLDQQLDALTLPDGTVVDFQYHATSGRLEAIAYPQGTVLYGYDSSTGQLRSITTPDGGSFSLTWDGFLVTDRTWSGGIAGTVHYTYDNDFRVASVAVNGGNAVSYVYDDDGLMTGAGSLVLSIDADTGVLAGTTLGSIQQQRTYDAYDDAVRDLFTYGSQTLLSRSYTQRDAYGRIVDLEEQVWDGSSLETHTYHYTYSHAGRLLQVDRDGALWEVYTFDPNGNRISATGPAVGPDGAVDAADIEIDDQDRLLRYGALELSYTEDGRLESKVDTATGDITDYVYDVFGNLLHASLPDGRSIDYVVDGSNRRIGRRVDGTLVQGWLYRDQLEPIAELNGSGAVVSIFVYGTRSNVPDYMVRDGHTYRILSDHLGSPRLVVDASSGAIAQRLEYDAWGRVLVDTNPGFQPFGFAGGLYDADTGLVRFGARDYDPQLGRWTTKDPIGFVAGDTNLYGYVANDPVQFIDPSGRELTPISDSEAGDSFAGGDVINTPEQAHEAPNPGGDPAQTHTSAPYYDAEGRPSVGDAIDEAAERQSSSSSGSSGQSQSKACPKKKK